MMIRSTFLGWVLLLCAATLHAQPDPRSYRFSHLGVDDGLAHRLVTAFAQDSTGYLWIGTKAGLNRFDGVTMRTYRHVRGDSTSLPGHNITALFVDARGTLWVGTNAGLSRFDRRTETFRTYRPAPDDPTGLCGPSVHRLARDGKGGLWIGTQENGLCHFNATTERFTHVPLLTAAPDRSRIVTDLTRTPSGDVWVSVAVLRGPSTVCRLDPATRACVPSSRTQQGGWPAVWSDADGTLWALQHERGLLRHDPATASFSMHTPAPVVWGSSAVAVLPDGTLWAGTPRKGIVHFDPSRRMAEAAARVRPDPGDPASLEGYDARALFVDRQGIVWVGHERGVSYWTGAQRPFRLYRTADGLSDERVNGLHEARDGAVWVATNGGLNRLAPSTDTFQSYQPATQGVARANAVWQVYEDRAGTLWVGGKKDGLLRFDRATERFEAVPGVARGVRSISEDRSGRLWMGTSSGLFVRDPDTEQIRAFRHDADDPRSLPNDRANVVHQTPDGTLWVGTDDGIARMDVRPSGDVRFDAFRYDANDATSLGAPLVWTMTHTPADPGALWVGTFGGGLCRLDRATERFRCLSTGDGLPHSVVYGVMADSTGALWVTTDGGLARIDPTTTRILTFGADDGLQGDAFDLMAYHRGRSGQMYVGGPRGFNAFDPGAVGADDYAPPVVIAGVRIFDQPRPGLVSPSGDTLRLRHDQTHVSFDLAALDYADPTSIRYRYRLTTAAASSPAGARGGTWRTTDGTRPFAAYTNLPPGAYTFAVRATNHAGVWSPHTARLHLVVEPAWWQTAWFRWGLALMAVGLVVGGIRWRLTALRAEQREQLHVQRRLAAERRRERHRLAQDLHDGPMQDLYRVGHDLDRLSTQQNNHAEAARATRQTVDDVARELRAILVALRPPHIAALGLPAALRSLVRTTERRHPTLHVSVHVSAQGSDALDALPDDAQYALYRVAQEALANAVQHATPERVTLTVHAEEETVALTVTDDGDGFVVPATLVAFARHEHFGLVGAAERAEAHDGRLDVTSAPGAGTTVRATLPRG